MPSPDEIFAKLDKDGNGCVTKEEFKAAHEAFMSRFKKPASKPEAKDGGKKPEAKGDMKKPEAKGDVKKPDVKKPEGKGDEKKGDKPPEKKASANAGLDEKPAIADTAATAPVAEEEFTD
jgi:hypothetical protein